MTKLLERAMRAASSLPPDAQDDLARMVLQAAGQGEGRYELTEDDVAAVARSREAARRGAFATDDTMRDLWAKYGL